MHKQGFHEEGENFELSSPGEGDALNHLLTLFLLSLMKKKLNVPVRIMALCCGYEVDQSS